MRSLGVPVSLSQLAAAILVGAGIMVVADWAGRNAIYTARSRPGSWPP